MNADTHPHHERAHAVWSASATSRNVVCAGAIAMATLCEDRESEAAAWGTGAHEVAQYCLRDKKNADDFLGMGVGGKKFRFEVDDEMATCTQTYVDYCRSRMAAYRQETGEDAQWWIEEKLTLAPLNPALEAGGTGDFVIYFPKWKLLEIVDLKGGRGVTVDVRGNPQGRTYAIGALLTMKDIAVDRIMVTIVQPRVGNGEPKSETFHISELLDWTVDLLAAMQRSKTALDEFTALGPNRVLFDEWAQKHLTTGQCTFCAAQAICPKRRQEALAAMHATAARYFEEVDSPMPDLSNTPRLASPEELARWLDGFEAIESWISAVRGYAHAEAERGVTIPGWQLADKIGNRKWIDEEKAIAAMCANNMSLDQIFENKLRSPAGIEKILGAKRKAEIEPLVERPVKGSNLVSASKTTRPPAKTTVERHFEQL